MILSLLNFTIITRFEYQEMIGYPIDVTVICARLIDEFKRADVYSAVCIL